MWGISQLEQTSTIVPKGRDGRVFRAPSCRRARGAGAPARAAGHPRGHEAIRRGEAGNASAARATPTLTNLPKHCQDIPDYLIFATCDNKLLLVFIVMILDISNFENEISMLINKFFRAWSVIVAYLI